MTLVVLLQICLLIYHVYSQAYDASTSLNCCPSSPAVLSCFNGEFNTTAQPQTKVYWFQLDLYQTQSVQFSSCNSDFDTQTEVWTSSKSLISTAYCYPGTYKNDDCGGCGNNERYTIPAMEAGTYYIYVGWIYHVTGYTDSPVGPTAALSIATTGCISSPPTKSPTINPTTSKPTTPTLTTLMPTTSMPTTSMPTTSMPTTSNPTTNEPSTIAPTTSEPSVASTTSTSSVVSTISTSITTTSIASITSTTSTTSTTATSITNIGKWRILFRLILNDILGLNPIQDTIDKHFIAFIESITKQAIYIQIISSNAGDDTVSIDDFEISVSSLKDINDGIDFTLKSTTNNQILSNKIENVLKNNFDDIREYILDKIKAYLADPSNGYDHINTENLSLQINISVDLSVSISSTMITSTLSTENMESSSSSKTANMTDIYFIGGVSILAFCTVLMICCFMKWSRKRKESKNKTELEIMPTKHIQQIAPSSPSSASNVNNGYNANMCRRNTDYVENTEHPENIKKKSNDVMSGFSSDNEVIYDGDLHTKFVNMVTSGDDIDYDSDHQQIHQIPQTIQIQQQRWIEQQIKQQQQQQNKMNKMNTLNTKMVNKLLAPLPKPPSEVVLGGQYTARMSMDPNGVPGLLNVDDQSEIDAYHEGVDNAINNNQIDHNYDDDNYNDHNDHDGNGQSEQKQPTVEYNQYNEHNQYNEYNIDNKRNEYNIHNFQLPEQPQINQNVFQTPGEEENSDFDK